MTRLLLCGLGACAAGMVLSPPAPLVAQGDVEWLGRHYGTRPPDAYFEQLRDDPESYQVKRGWRSRLEMLSAARSGALAGGAGGPQGVLGPREGTVQGNFSFPLILGLFSDSPTLPPHSASEVQANFFDGPNPTGTIEDFYREISGGLVNLSGVALPWQRVQMTATQVAGGQSGLSSPARVGDYIVEILAALDSTAVDWGRFDSDGPDGVPNSGDDDGFVDLLTIMHPDFGAECTGDQQSNRIWSHQWQIAAWRGSPYTSATAAAGGGFIRIDDYAIQPVRACDGQSINQIGVFAHELGHGFGLPDLYDTSLRHEGAGSWDLMASGAWGCRGGTNDPARPCHMGAWSKAVLGWVNVQELDPGVDHGTLTLQPVESARTVYKVPAGDGSADYLLIENREPIGYDGDLVAPGLLVWHIDPVLVNQRWPFNGVNSANSHMGVWLRQADGRDDLGRTSGGNRADAGDPYPGSTQNRFFHAGSNPSSFSHAGGAMGVTLMDITRQGTDMRFRVLTRFQDIAIDIAGGVGGPGTIVVDGAAAAGGAALHVASAPFQSHVITAAPGAEIDTGIRRGFSGWEDGSPRVRTFQTGLSDSLLIASYDGSTEFQVALTQSSSETVAPGSVSVAPSLEGGWVPSGAEVEIRATARTGFAFREWTGALVGSPNPVTLTIAAPLHAEAIYDVTYAVAGPPASLDLEGGRAHEFTFQVENANLPAVWRVVTGALPQGLSFTDQGVLSGAPLLAGTFPVRVQVTDQIGLTAAVDVSVVVGAPAISSAELTGPILGTGPALDPLQAQFFDRNGNGNGQYDLGDLRAFLIAFPGSPAAAGARDVVRVLLPAIDLKPAGEVPPGGHGPSGGER